MWPNVGAAMGVPMPAPWLERGLKMQKIGVDTDGVWGTLSAARSGVQMGLKRGLRRGIEPRLEWGLERRP